MKDQLIDLISNANLSDPTILVCVGLLGCALWIGYEIWDSNQTKWEEEKKTAHQESLKSLRKHIKDEKEIFEYKKRFEKLKEPIIVQPIEEEPTTTQPIEEGIEEMKKGVSEIAINPQDQEEYFENIEDLYEARKNQYYQAIHDMTEVYNCDSELEKLIKTLNEENSVESELVEHLDSIREEISNYRNLSNIQENAYAIIDLCCQNTEFFWFCEALLKILTQ